MASQTQLTVDPSIASFADRGYDYSMVFFVEPKAVQEILSAIQIIWQSHQILRYCFRYHTKVLKPIYCNGSYLAEKQISEDR